MESNKKSVAPTGEKRALSKKIKCKEINYIGRQEGKLQKYGYHENRKYN